MKCGCIERVKNRLAEMYKPEAGDDVTVECPMTTIVFGNPGYTTLNIDFRVRSSKRGFNSKAGKSVAMLITYCPFCGKPVQEKPDGTTADKGSGSEAGSAPPDEPGG